MHGIAPIWTAMEHGFAPIWHKSNAQQWVAVGYNGADFGPIWAKVMHGFVSGSVMITPDFVLTD